VLATTFAPVSTPSWTPADRSPLVMQVSRRAR
jgi:hypothetical protein